MKDIGFWHQNDGDELKITGRFLITAVPAMGAFVGQGFTPTRVGAGDYLLTFTHAVQKLVSAKVTTQVAGAATDIFGQLGVFTAGAGGVASLQIRTTAAGGGPVEVTGNDWVHFELTVYGELLAT